MAPVLAEQCLCLVEAWLQPDLLFLVPYLHLLLSWSPDKQVPRQACLHQLGCCVAISRAALRCMHRRTSKCWCFAAAVHCGDTKRKDASVLCSGKNILLHAPPKCAMNTLLSSKWPVWARSQLYRGRMYRHLCRPRTTTQIQHY